MKQRSTIDWSNPPKPGVFAEVELTKKAVRAPAIVGDHGIAVLATPSARKCAGLGLPTLIYYVREACIMFPAFREELEVMLSLIPTSGATEAPPG